MKRLIRFDWAIKRILRNKANFGILGGFLTELLGEEISIESILESESNKETGDNKSNRVDLLIKNSREELIIIEIQSNRVHDYLMRMLFGTSKLIVDNLDMGMGYNKIKKVISVNIVYFDLGVGDDYVYYGTTSFIGVHTAQALLLSREQELLYHTNEISKIYPEYYLIKVNQFNDIALNTLDEWIYFLKNEQIKDSFKAKGLKEAKERLDILKLSDEERIDYDNYIKDWRDYNSLTVSNYEAGKAIGEANKEEYAQIKAKEQQLEMAKRCLAKGMPVEDIAEVTKLDVETIKAMQL